LTTCGLYPFNHLKTKEVEYFGTQCCPISERVLRFEGFQASPACPSENSSIKMSVQHWRNDTDRGKLKYWEKTLYSVGGRWMNEYGALVE
jgi:hypothetical protein